jgi:prolyl 4-hydroxylase
MQAQTITREMQDWVAEQLAAGYTPHEDFPGAAGCRLASGRRQPGLGPAGARAAMPQPALAVPWVKADASGAMVDAGDKWVTVREHRSAPELWVFGNLLSAAECEALMEAAEPRLARSLTVDIRTGGEELNHDRTSHGMFYTRGEHEVVQPHRGPHRQTAELAGAKRRRPAGAALPARRRIQTALRLLRSRRARHRGHPAARRPARGQPHHVFAGARRGRRHGVSRHRPAVRPQRGSAVFFSYALAHPASLTLHGGEPVKVGEKWIATKWLREREFI